MMSVRTTAAHGERTIRAALRLARAALAPSETADLDAQVLLAQVLGVERAFLFAHGEINA